MEKSDKQEQRKNKFTEIKTYPVPFASEEIARDITFTTNIPSKPSKEEIISQALKLHSEGRIQKELGRGFLLLIKKSMLLPKFLTFRKKKLGGSFYIVKWD